jgi:hypothetical protein
LDSSRHFHLQNSEAHASNSNNYTRLSSFSYLLRKKKKNGFHLQKRTLQKTKKKGDFLFSVLKFQPKLQISKHKSESFYREVRAENSQCIGNTAPCRSAAGAWWSMDGRRWIVDAQTNLQKLFLSFCLSTLGISITKCCAVCVQLVARLIACCRVGVDQRYIYIYFFFISHFFFFFKVQPILC